MIGQIGLAAERIEIPAAHFGCGALLPRQGAHDRQSGRIAQAIQYDWKLDLIAARVVK